MNKFNYPLNQFSNSINTIKRIISTSTALKRRPPHHRSAFRKTRQFPFIKSFYDNDIAGGPYKVVIDEIKRYPPGKWGGMSIKESWQRYKEVQHLHGLPSYFDKLQSMSWREHNMFYHTVRLPLLLPETLHFSQFITRTKLNIIMDSNNGNIPDTIKDNIGGVTKGDIDRTCGLLKRHLENYFQMAAPPQSYFNGGGKEERKRESGEFICEILDTVARSRGSVTVGDCYYEDYTTSPNSIIETFIKRVGYDRLETSEMVKDSEGCVKYRIKGNLAWQLRSRAPLKQFIKMDDPILFNEDNKFPIYDYHPKMFNLTPADCASFSNLPFTYSKHSSEYVRNIPGFWGKSPFKEGDPCAFSVLGVINTDLSRDFEDCYRSEHQEIIDRHHISEAIFTGFTWTMAQAQNQGFSIYDEITYPFCCCIMLTDGKQMQMAYYQLNSISSLWKPEDANFPSNIIWIAPKIDLFESDSSGKTVNINENAVRQILATFSMPKSDLRSEDLQPYLKQESSSDVKQLMIHFDAETATEKEVEEYKVKSRHQRLYSYGKPHPNRMFYFDKIEKHELDDELRQLVPGIGSVPADVNLEIENRKRLLEKVKRGKKKVMKEPSKWQ